VLFLYHLAENRKWWRVTGNAMDVSSGLTPLILFTTTAPDSTSNFAVMDSSGNFQIVYGHLESISAAPYGVWGLQGDQLWQKRKFKVNCEMQVASLITETVNNGNRQTTDTKPWSRAVRYIEVSLRNKELFVLKALHFIVSVVSLIYIIFHFHGFIMCNSQKQNLLMYLQSVPQEY
jgi:hypothetical protein